MCVYISVFSFILLYIFTMNQTNHNHDQENKQQAKTTNNCQDVCKDMYHSKKFWIGAIIRILFMVALIIAAYIFGLQQGMMKGMWMTSMGGVQQWYSMKGIKNRGGMEWKMMNKNMPQQTKDGVPVMTITEGTGTATGN